MNRLKRGTALIATCALMTLSGCAMGIEKEYEMDIKCPYIAIVEEGDGYNGSDMIAVIHCKRGMSLYNYYIQLPDEELDKMQELYNSLGGFAVANFSPEHLKAKKTTDITKFTLQEGQFNEDDKLVKDLTVSDHGYKFISWDAFE